MGALRQDVRFGLRHLLRHPGFFAVVVGTLAVAIGANTAIFSVISAVLLRPLPYDHPDRLVMIRHDIGASGFTNAPLPPADVIDLRERTTAFDGIAATDRTFEVNLTGDGPPEVVRLASVTANFFQVLGVQADLGRALVPADGNPAVRKREGEKRSKDAAEDAPAAYGKKEPGVDASPLLGPLPVTERPPAVVISHGLWLRRFGGDPGVLGRVVYLDGRPNRVVGVLSRSFRLYMPADAGMPTNVDVWAPTRFDYRDIPRNSANANRRVIARLAPGVDLSEAREQVESVVAWQRERFGYHRGGEIRGLVKPLHEEVVAEARPTLLALFGAALFVLLVACANVANLLLVRSAAREREISIRVAVGGGRRRIARQLLTEAGLLAVFGGLAGLLLARWGIDLLMAFRPAALPRADHVAMDLPVFLFTAATTVVAALLFGLFPAVWASRPDLSSCLQERGACAPDPAGRRLRAGIVVGEVAIAMVLLVGAGLMFRSFHVLQRTDLGFDPSGVLTARLTLPTPEYGLKERTAFLARLEASLEARPDVRAAGFTQVLPLGGQFWTSPYQTSAEEALEEVHREADYRFVTPGLFRALGLRLLEGRVLEPEDVKRDRDVVVIDRALAAAAWPGEDPLGRKIRAGTLMGDTRWFKVVGVVETVRSEGPERPIRETIYFPHSLQGAFPAVTLVVRAEGVPARELAAPVRASLAALDPDLPIAGMRVLREYVEDALAPARFAAVLIGLFAGVALLLATVGLFGVVASLVRSRTREIGIRMAFGAAGPQVLGLVVRRGMTLAAAGLALGVVASVALSRVLAGLLVGVRPVDPATYAAVAAVLLLVTLVACVVPARRAWRVDPARALRYE